MKCDECGVEAAVIHLTRVVEGRASDRHLCLKCAGVDAGTGGGDIGEVMWAWVERESRGTKDGRG